MIKTVDESLGLLNIPVARYVLAKNVPQVSRSAKKFGFPVVLKLVSPKVIHKTEVGGVQFVRDEKELAKVARAFLKKGKVLVQEQVKGVEFFLGIKKDPTFGHVLLAGLGGIFVEVYKDLAFRVCPVTKRDAEQMLGELKGKAILDGVRGQKPINRKALIDAMVSLSELPKKIKDLEELDVNPLFVNEKEVKAVDARFVLHD